MKSHTIQEINDILKGEIIGNTSQSITAPNS
jgi:UDP-3-O-[3-hydroxymyristoyl] glucosamine N-acyltransferase